MNNFINTFKSIDHDTTEFRLSAQYTTNNKKYIWRDENHNKLDDEDHYILLHRVDNKLYFTIGKDAPDDKYYDEENFYYESDTYSQDDNESDEDFLNFCKDLIQSENIIINDDLQIDQFIMGEKNIDINIDDAIREINNRKQSRKPLINI